ncbi:MAG: DUF192 domain-containing protein [Treponema sp.]|jgi:uncharacterized membrane protein (UPF0127 family)|nr:DUF192 domain-containing protein [Treponema sp.]
MISNRITVFLFLFLIASASLSCGAQGNGRIKKFETREFTIEREGGGNVTIMAEIAGSAPERAQGLMYRKSLADGKGMIFVFERDETLSFWMKNTLIPLSIAFISHQGKILEIRDMKPGDLNTLRSSRSARYALEVPQGWFERAGIKAGDSLFPGDL